MRDPKDSLAFMLFVYGGDLIPQSLLEIMVFNAVRDDADMIALKSHNELVTHSVPLTLATTLISCHFRALRSSFGP